MTDAPRPSDVAAAWPTLRQVFKDIAAKYNDQCGHELCPWSFDAVELNGALEWMDTVVAAALTPPAEGTEDMSASAARAFARLREERDQLRQELQIKNEVLGQIANKALAAARALLEDR